jgi:hypothetical protein
MFEPKRDEVAGEWRKLYSEELHILYSSPNIIRENRVGGTCGRGKCTRFCWESQKEREYLEHQGIDVGMRSELNVEWIQLAQDKDQCGLL